MMNSIWIDLDNSPHVPLFKPIIQELRRRGYTVILTGRDCFQVSELVKRFQLPCTIIGHHYGKNKFLKVVGLFIRALQMKRFIAPLRPSLALSHGSRSQLLVAWDLGIPSILMMDYEYTTWLPIARPTLTLVPEVVFSSLEKRKRGTIRLYPGMKEDIYVPAFTPDPDMRSQLGVAEDEILVTIRPPATEAHYHNPRSEDLFKHTVNFVAQTPGCRIVVLPRTPTQGNQVKTIWLRWYRQGKIMIPEKAVDGLSLIWFSDLVVSGGGTMNREAAALGVPVYSIFQGKLGAVDRHLAEIGKLHLLREVDDVPRKISVRRRNRPTLPTSDNSPALNRILEEVVSLLAARVED